MISLKQLELMKEAKILNVVLSVKRSRIAHSAHTYTINHAIFEQFLKYR